MQALRCVFVSFGKASTYVSLKHRLIPATKRYCVGPMKETTSRNISTFSSVDAKDDKVDAVGSGSGDDVDDDGSVDMTI